MSASLVEGHAQVLDGRGFVIYTNIPVQCQSCVSDCNSESELTSACGERGKRRRGRLTSQDGSAFFCTKESNFVSSSKVFRKELAMLLHMNQRISQIREEISQQETAKARRLIHNLITLNAHALQDLYSVINQEELAAFTQSSYRSQRELIKNKLMSNPKMAADLFTRALKNGGAVKNELAVFKRMYDSGSMHKRDFHSIHRVVLNVVNYFFQDFTDKQIGVLIEDFTGKVAIDYESVQVALYHLFDNAAKYCAPHTDLKISFALGESQTCLLLDMQSCHVPDEERQKIYEDGFSGSVPRSQESAGQGMGMGLVRELLRLNNAEIDAQWGRSDSFDSRYAHNTIIVRFKNTHNSPAR